MGKTVEQKNVIIAELKESLSKSQLAVIIDYQGLSVAEITDFFMRRMKIRMRKIRDQCRMKTSG